jgi:hypothetical protein
MHILTGSYGGIYRVIVHAPTPAGTNGAGVLWSDALKNSGRAITRMTVGNGAGQITNAEANNVAAGSVLEAEFNWQDDPNWNALERTADLNLRATQAVTEILDVMTHELRQFGQTVV